MKRALALGILLWLVATAILRLSPVRLPDSSRAAAILVLYAVSFALLFVLIRTFVAPPAGGAEGLRSGIALFLPTLVLDALASAFFPAAYPNFSPETAGIFGGWMLVCCGGGLAGLVSRPPRI